MFLKTGLGTRKHTFLALSNLLSPSLKVPGRFPPQSEAASVASLCCFITLLFGYFPIAFDFALIARETKARWGSLGGR